MDGETNLERRFGVEHALYDAEPLDTEDLVPAVGHLERTRRLCARSLGVGVLRRGILTIELAGPLPYLDDALFERG